MSSSVKRPLTISLTDVILALLTGGLWIIWMFIRREI